MKEFDSSLQALYMDMLSKVDICKASASQKYFVRHYYTSGAMSENVHPITTMTPVVSGSFGK